MGPARLPGAQDSLVLTDAETHHPPPAQRTPQWSPQPPRTWTWPSGSGLPSLEDLFPASGDALILRTECIHLPSFSVRSDHPHAISHLHSWNPPAGADGTIVTPATPGSTGTEAPGEETVTGGQAVPWSWS